MKCEFRDISGFPGYLVCSNGSVWSKWTRVGVHGVRGTRWEIGIVPMELVGSSDRRGYRFIKLRRNQKTFTRRVSRLVLEVFVGPCPPGMECRHHDGNKLNNNLDNLSWSTHIDNCLDRIAHGTESIGENNPAVKITASTVPMIRADWSSGMTCSQLSKKYGLSIAQVHKIATRKVWKSVA